VAENEDRQPDVVRHEDASLDAAYNEVLRERAASGLDESQIESADIEKLHAAFVPRKQQLKLHTSANTLDPEFFSSKSFGLQSRKVSGIGFEDPQTVKLRIAPLPTRVKVRRQKLRPLKLRPVNGLSLMREQPVSRLPLPVRKLDPEMARELFRKLFEKFGKAAERCEVLAVYRGVPPAAAKSIQVEPGPGSLQFLVPGKLRGSGIGYCAVIYADPDGRIRRGIYQLSP
jgi:hypothetical protein